MLSEIKPAITLEAAKPDLDEKKEIEKTAHDQGGVRMSEKENKTSSKLDQKSDHTTLNASNIARHSSSSESKTSNHQAQCGSSVDPDSYEQEIKVMFCKTYFEDRLFSVVLFLVEMNEAYLRQHYKYSCEFSDKSVSVA